MTQNFDTLLNKYHKEKKSDSRAKTITLLINLLEHSWFSNLNNPLILELEKTAKDPHEFLFLGYFYFYQNKNSRSLEAFSKAVSMLDMSTPTFIAQFLFTELIKPEYKKQKRLDSLRKHISSHLINSGEFEKAFLFIIEVNLNDMIPILFEQVFKRFETNKSKLYVLLKAIFYIINRPELPEHTDKNLIITYLISSLEALQKDSTGNKTVYLLFKCYNQMGLYRKIANLIAKLSLNRTTIKLALQICFDLSETEPAIVLNTVKAFFIETCVGNKEEQKVIGFDQIVEVLEGTTKGKLMSTYTKNRSVPEKSTLSKIKYVTEYSHQANLFCIVGHSLVGFGTNNATFLNNRSRWLSGKEHWAQYISSSCFGNIFAQTEVKPLELLEKLLETAKESQLPILTIHNNDNNSNFNSNSQGVYYMGGILQAVGTVAFNSPVTSDFPVLASALSSYLNSANGITQYGACISIGLLLCQNGYITTSIQEDTSILLQNDFIKKYIEIENKLVENIKGKVDENHFEIGDAASVALGFIYAGTNRNDFEETKKLMLNKIYNIENSAVKRGLAIGLALMHYKKNDETTLNLSKKLIKMNDWQLRLAGVLILAMGYTNTNLDTQFVAVDLLLESLETEANEDVTFFIVLGLSLIMTNHPEQIENIIDLSGISKHYNMKYKMGACIALGVAACNSSDSVFVEKVIKALTLMTNDDRKIVQNAAWVGLGLSMANNKHLERKTNEFFEDILLSEDVKEITRMGAILGFGFKRAGGQTAGVFTQNKDSFGACAGLIFLGMSYKWFPYLSLVGISLKHDYKADVAFETVGDKVNLLLLNNNKTYEEDKTKKSIIVPEQAIKQANSEKWAISKDILKNENTETSLKKLIQNKEESVKKFNNMKRLNFRSSESTSSVYVEDKERKNKRATELKNYTEKKTGIVVLDLEELKKDNDDDLEGIII